MARSRLDAPWNDPNADIAFARRSPHATVLIAEQDARIVAAIMTGEDGHRGWMYYVAAEPDMRGQGLGRAIVEAAETWLSARGVWKVNLMIRRDNAPVRSFYANLGYADSDVDRFQKSLEPVRSD